MIFLFCKHSATSGSVFPRQACAGSFLKLKAIPPGTVEALSSLIADK
jgi:hypothetical protein